MKTGNFTVPIGIEFSCIIESYAEEFGYPTDTTVYATEEAVRSINESMRKHYPDSLAHRDGHCVEFDSPVFKTWEELREFYSRWEYAMKKAKCVPHLDEITVCGGGHIHFDILSSRKWLSAKVFRYFVKNPWIAWAFSMPDDEDSGRSWLPYTSKELPSPMNNYNVSPLDFMLNEYTDEIHTENNKDFAITTNNVGKTLEIRCCEAPNNWDELVDQVDFFDALHEAVFNGNVNCYYVPTTHRLSKTQMQRLSKEYAAEQFNRCLAELGLDKQRYQYLIKRNILPRWQLGRKRC